MQDKLGTASDGTPQRPTWERALKLAIFGLFIFIGVQIVGDWLQTIIDSTKRSRIEGDFKTIAKAIERRGLKDPFLDWDVSKLQGEELANIPRDPWGNPYIYDWFNGRLVCKGPDGTLSVPVAGLSSVPIAGVDDEVYQLRQLSQLIVSARDPAGSILYMVGQDGSTSVELARLPGASVIGLDAMGKEPLILVASKAGARQTLTSLQFADSLDRLLLVEPPYPSRSQVVVEGTDELSAPSLYSASNDWIFYACKKSGRSWDLYRAGYKTRDIAQITQTPGDDRTPSVDPNGKLIYYAAPADGRTVISRFTMASFQDPKVVLQRPGTSLASPAPAPQGELLAVLEGQPGGQVLKVFDLRNQQEIFTQPACMPDTPIVWSPEGDKIGYFVKADPSPQLELAHVRKNVKVRLESLPFTVEPGRFAWISR